MSDYAKNWLTFLAGLALGLAIIALAGCDYQDAKVTAAIAAERDAAVLKREPLDCMKRQHGRWLRWQITHRYEPDEDGRRFYTIDCAYGYEWKYLTPEAL